MSYNEALIIRQFIPQKNPAPKQTEETNTSEPHTPSVYLRLKTIFTEFLRTFSFFASNAEKKEEKPPFAKAQQLTIAPLSPTALVTQFLNISRIFQFFQFLGLTQKPPTKTPQSHKRITPNPSKTEVSNDATPVLKPVPLTGFINNRTNGWETALMQMIINTPSLLQAYLTIGNHYQDKEMGRKLLAAYDAYTQSLETNPRTPVDAIHSKHVCEFFATSNPNEALNLLLKKYREILNKMGLSGPSIPTFTYSSTIQQPSKENESKSSHITLYPLPQNENKFLSMLSSHFPREEQTPPPELIITLQRLPTNGTKINNPVDVPLEFKLPKEISPNNDPTYELTSFVVHTGAFSTTGGYVTYRKTEDQWFLCNNENIEAVSIEQVKDALKSSYIHHYKNT